VTSLYVPGFPTHQYAHPISSYFYYEVAKAAVASYFVHTGFSILV